MLSQTGKRTGAKSKGPSDTFNFLSIPEESSVLTAIIYLYHSVKSKLNKLITFSPCVIKVLIF